MEDDLNGKKMSMEKKTLRKPYMKMTLGCLVSQFCTELGPAQPQLVPSYSGSAPELKLAAFVDLGSIVQCDKHLGHSSTLSHA